MARWGAWFKSSLRRWEVGLNANLLPLCDEQQGSMTALCCSCLCPGSATRSSRAVSLYAVHHQCHCLTLTPLYSLLS